MDYYNPVPVEQCRDIDFKGKLNINFTEFLCIVHEKTRAAVERIGSYVWKPGCSYAQTKFFRKQSFIYEQKKLKNDIVEYRVKLNEFFHESRQLLLNYMHFVILIGYKSHPAFNTKFDFISKDDDNDSDELYNSYMNFLDDEAWTNNTNRMTVVLELFKRWYALNKEVVGKGFSIGFKNKLQVFGSKLEIFSGCLLKIMKKKTLVKSGKVRDLLSDCKNRNVDWL